MEWVERLSLHSTGLGVMDALSAVVAGGRSATCGGEKEEILYPPTDPQTRRPTNPSGRYDCKTACSIWAGRVVSRQLGIDRGSPCWDAAYREARQCCMYDCDDINGAHFGASSKCIDAARAARARCIGNDPTASECYNICFRNERVICDALWSECAGRANVGFGFCMAGAWLAPGPLKLVLVDLCVFFPALITQPVPWSF